MELQTFNYHTHTYRCGHAQGSAEEMIQAAIQGGFKTIGISEHMGYEDWDDPKERPNFADIDDYLHEMIQLKEKYQDQIEVRIGFECEYFSDVREYLEQMRKNVIISFVDNIQLIVLITIFTLLNILKIHIFGR